VNSSEATGKQAATGEQAATGGHQLGSYEGEMAYVAVLALPVT
jgi:hypothetical protein